ncbi:unnamed protein product [Soboliphyme baturini]|uniref:NDK domain-containing protein n=1 Tax=Soboliphyme baturini TaxID=241478 RepID=A0A183J057_9BILA|nr:unnamed protein product [Soboliphyme baturini]
MRLLGDDGEQRHQQSQRRRTDERLVETAAALMQMAEKTLAIVKPEASEQLKQIETEILKQNLTIAADTAFGQSNRESVVSACIDFVSGTEGLRCSKPRKDIILTKEQCADFCMDSSVCQSFCYPTEKLAGKTCHAMLLSGRHAIGKWRRAIEYLQSPITDSADTSPVLRLNLPKNSVHASENFIRAQREIEFIFPEVELEPWSEEIMNYLSAEVIPTLSKCLMEMVAADPEDPLMWLAKCLKEKALATESC